MNENARVRLGIGQIIADNIRIVNDKFTITSNWVGDGDRVTGLSSLIVEVTNMFSNSVFAAQVMPMGEPTVAIYAAAWGIDETIQLSDPQLFEKINSIVFKTVGFELNNQEVVTGE